ncbi:hypothetical protein SBA7_840010 [Candidatus Sulfotelmatobacter sp. SbA7]|nr:hypothetical protein SBA7_840010 [Candidatus Sulfotelmatobacter sp. SbA7]
MADVGDGANVAEGHERVGGSLDINHTCVPADGAFYVLHIGSVHVSEFNPIAGKNLVKQAGDTAIKVVPGDHMVSRPKHGAESVDGGHAAGENSRGDSAFERCQVFFEASARRIRNASVLVALVLAQFLLEVRRSGIDRDCDGAGLSVGFLTGVNGASGKAGEFGFGHRDLNQQLALGT